MRPQIVIPVLLALVVGLGAIFFFKGSNQPTPPSIEAVQPVVSVPRSETPPVKTEPVPVTQATPVATVVVDTNPAPIAQTTSTPPVEDPKLIQEKLNQLDDLQYKNDAASLQAILNELTNSSPVIRHAAIESAIQYGDRSAIPVLKALAEQTTDEAEKKELLDAANFIALPTISDARAAKKAGQSTETAPQQ